MTAELIAHVRQNADGCWEVQKLTDHLAGVARLAGQFAAKFGNRDWGEILGYWHDLGKFHPAWQDYLRVKSGYDSEAHMENRSGRPNHSTAGAVLALEKGQKEPPSKILPYALAGHHAGLPDWQPDDAEGDLVNRLFLDILKGTLDRKDLDVIQAQKVAMPFIDLPLPKSIPGVLSSQGKGAWEHIHLWIRMLFSCLVDADFLDTESFMNPEQEKIRGNYLPLSELKTRLAIYMQNKEQNAPDTFINQKRKMIRLQCIEKAKLEPGFFSLTVPTGGGKTLSAMSFALEHALQHNKDRIIIAIPYTSIIEQTAKVFKYGSDNDAEIDQKRRVGEFLFGEDQVLEHHSNLDPDTETAKSRLSAENWDAPIIVTTNVQLFESLFASRPSVCRKLHNISNSVIILDEVQMMPPEFLKPILSVLKGLVKHFGVTVVLMTATQPALEGTIGSPPNLIDGVENVRSIIDEPEALAREFSRIDLDLPQDLNQPKQWAEIQTELVRYPQVLCIVNSRKDCRELHSLMPEDTIHLSALMCGEERSAVISGIKEKLKRREPVRVISTQLVEAGVDIDFPVVYRALAGFDSIAQAAGRCNRENNLANVGKKGKVTVFVPPKPAPPGLLLKGENACKEILRNYRVDELSPELFREYFRHFYATLNNADKPRFYQRLVQDAAIFEFSFRTLARDFQLIKDEQQSIIVFYKNPRSGKGSHELIEQLRRNGPNRKLLRQLQRFVVNIYPDTFARMQKLGYIEELAGFWVQSSPGIYQPGIGLKLDESGWLENTVI